jgi:hypothetical protein
MKPEMLVTLRPKEPLRVRVHRRAPIEKSTELQ